MICQLCGKNQATVCLNIDMNGQRSTLFLCEECANARKLKENPSPALLLAIINEIRNKTGEELKAEIPDARCEACGTSYEEYTKSGLLGCPDCYKYFEELLSSVFSRITKPLEVTVENASRQSQSINNELLKLQLQLKHCVENEQYEEAAKLRDKINSFKAGNEVDENGEK